MPYKNGKKISYGTGATKKKPVKKKKSMTSENIFPAVIGIPKKIGMISS